MSEAAYCSEGALDPFDSIGVERKRVGQILLWIALAFCALPTLMLLAGNGQVSHEDESVRRILAATSEESAGALLTGNTLSGVFTHAMMEWAAFAASVLVGCLAFVHYRVQGKPVVLMLGVALFLGGVVDMFHLLAFNQFAAIATELQDRIAMSWAVGRTCSLLILVVTLGTMLYGVRRSDLHFTLRWVGLAGIVLGFAAYSAIHWIAGSSESVQALFPGDLRLLSVFSRPWDLLPLAVALGAAVLLMPAFQRRFRGGFVLAVWAGLIPTAMAHAHMSLGSIEAFDTHFSIAHSLKIVAIAIPCLGLLVDLKAHFQQEYNEKRALRTRAGALEERVDEKIKELHQLEQRSRGIVTAIPSGLAVLGRDSGTEEYSVRTTNPIFREIFQVGRGDLRGLTIHNLVRVLQIPSEPASEIAGLDEFDASEWECTLNQVPARHVSLSLTKTHVLNNDSGETERLLIVNDVTKRVILERGLEQAQKLEAIGRLAGGVAHDFNNLLMVINGYSRALGKRVEGDEALADLVGEISDAGERAAGLTRQLLAFGRQQVLEPKPIEVSEALADMERMLRQLVGEKVVIESQYAADSSVIRVDRSQLEQVVMNLVVNARDAMPRGGSIRIATASVELDENYIAGDRELEAGSYVELSIADDGEGMDAATIENIFEPFYTTKELGRGTGLGLATVHGIIKQSGGHIEVQSKVGQGTTFKVYFRRVEGSGAPTGTPVAIDATARGSEHILLVEDEAPIRNLVKHTLNEQGYQVSVAEDGVDALELFASSAEKFALLLTDVIMPRMGGIELAKKLRELDSELGVVYMSGYTANAFDDGEGAVPGASFIHKPCAAPKLLASVRRVLDSADPVAKG